MSSRIVRRGDWVVPAPVGVTPQRTGRVEVRLRASALLRTAMPHATMVLVSSGIAKFRRVLLLVGSLGPLGHAPASGSVTVAVIGVPLFWLMSDWTHPVYVVVVAVFSGVAVWLHDVGDRLLGEKDSRKLVWDELVGFMIAVYAVPFTWQLALAAFLVERVIDIVKVPPANWIERRVGGGWGVVGDDVVAGIYTCVLLQAAIRYFPAAVGLGT